MAMLVPNTLGFAKRTRLLAGEGTRNASQKRSSPTIEELDKLVLLSVGCPVISGYVYLDQNSNPVLTNNGNFDAGERPLGGAQVLLFDVNNQLVASTTTDINGAYTFDGLPNTSGTQVQIAQTLTIGATPTPFANAPFNPTNLSLFDPSLGTLNSVTITYNASVSSNLLAQNPAPIPQPMTAELNGNYQINGLGQAISGTGTATSGPVTIGADDPLDPTANDFPVNLKVDGQTRTLNLSSAADLAFFTASAGRSSISPTLSATADAVVTGSGIQFTKVTTGEATISVVFHYTPKICIPNGQYTIVQNPNLPQLTNGKESQPGVVFPAPPEGQPQILHVTVQDVDLPDNNFAKLTPGAVSPEVICPTPEGIVRYGVHRQQTKLVLSFSGNVDPTLANDPSRYRVVAANGGTVRIVSATFDAATNSVTLIPARRLNVHHRFDLSVKVPCVTGGDTVTVPFGGRETLGGFRSHRGQFVPVSNGHLVRPGAEARPNALALRARARARLGRG